MDPTTQGWLDHDKELLKQQEHYRKLRGEDKVKPVVKPIETKPESGR